MSDNKNIKTEVQFDEVIKSPLSLFGLIYLISIIAIVMGGAFYLRKLDYNSDNNKKFHTGEVKEEIADLATKKATALQGVDVNVVGKPSDELIAKGADSFAKNCVSCHGEKGDGNGVAGASLNPKPRNFTSADAWKNGRKVSQIYKTLELGIANSGMSSFSHLPVDERFALIHYVRNFKKDDAPEVTEDELSEIDLTYNLSVSRVTKAQIPVAKAFEILVNENNTTKKSKIDAMIAKTNTDDKGKALSNLICNKDKALKFLLDNSNWKSGASEFLKTVSASSPNNGFKTEISRISKDELSSVYSYLMSLYN